MWTEKSKAKMYDSNILADAPVSGEGVEGGDPHTVFDSLGAHGADHGKAAVFLQPIERHGHAEIHLQPMEEPHTRTGGCLRGGFVGAPCCTRVLKGTYGEEPMLEKVSW